MKAPDTVFVGAEYEEKLSSRTMAAVARKAGFTSGVAGFNSVEDTPLVVTSTIAAGPRLVGLSMAFQHRAPEFLRLAESLRREGYAGHIVAGGHFATATAAEVLERHAAVDTVVSFDGETPLGMLLERIDEPGRGGEIPGLAYRGAGGKVTSNEPETAPRDLDPLPWPIRDTPLKLHMGFPFTSLCGSRGCYGNCTFCAINSYHRGRPGPRLRFRSPESIAREIAWLWHEKGARIFCFHDDTWFLPNRRRMIERMDELAAHLDRLGVVQPVAMVAKARPDAIDAPLLAHLRERLGLMRLYVGIENFSAAGIEHLGRRVTRDQIDASLEACTAAGVYGCYNLLVFEPDARLEDAADNVEGMRKFESIPVHFCRAEAYNGTALHTYLKKTGRIRGNYLASDYVIADPRMEALFRVTYQAFKDRNFSADALANMNMSIGYELQILHHFGGEEVLGGDLGRMDLEAADLMTSINRNSREHLSEAVEFVKGGGWRDPAGSIAFTVDLAGKINFEGAALHTRLLEVRRSLQDLASRLPGARRFPVGGDVETSGLSRTNNEP